MWVKAFPMSGALSLVLGTDRDMDRYKGTAMDMESKLGLDMGIVEVEIEMRRVQGGRDGMDIRRGEMVKC